MFRNSVIREMMKILLLAFLFNMPISLFAQNFEDTLKVIRLCPPADSSNSPLFYIVFDNNEMLLDSFEVAQIDPNHIKSIEVLKNSDMIKEYETEVGVVLIYPKRKFIKKYRKVFVKEE